MAGIGLGGAAGLQDSIERAKLSYTPDEAARAQLEMATKAMSRSDVRQGLGIADPVQRSGIIADYDEAASAAGVPAGIDANPARPFDQESALGLPSSAPSLEERELAEAALQNGGQLPAVIGAPVAPQRPSPGVGRGSPLRDEREIIDSGFEALGDAQARGAEAAAEGADQQAQVIRDTQGRIEEKAQNRSEAMAAQALANEQFAAEQQQRLEEFQAKVAEKEAEIAQDVERVRNQEIDPNGFFRGEDGEIDYGTKVGASIAMALGAMGSAFTGGPNIAMQIINNAIERDMKAQTKNLANQRAALGDRKSALAMYMDKFGDERAARLAAFGALNQSYAQRIDQAATEIADVEQAGQLKKMAAQKEMEGQQALTEAAKLAAQNEIQRGQAMVGVEQAESGLKSQRVQRAATLDQMRARREAAEAKAFQRDPKAAPGLGGAAFSDKEAQEQRKDNATYANTISRVDNMRRLYEDFGTLDRMRPEQRQMVNQAYQDLKGAVLRLREAGSNLTEGEERLAEGQIGVEGAFQLFGSKDKALANFQDRLYSELETKAKARGYQGFDRRQFEAAYTSGTDRQAEFRR